MSPHDFHPDALLLDRYLHSEVTEAERHAIDAWLLRNPDEHHALKALRRGMAAKYGPVPSYDVDARVAAIVDHSVRAARHVRRHAPLARGIPRADGLSRRIVSGWMRVATVAAVVILGLIVVRTVGVPRVTRGQTTYATAAGQRATITLTDGSRVTLAPQSRLLVAEGFGASARTVVLTGQAHFTVTSMAGAPFVVQTGAVTTRVLGTTFDVRHYAADSVVRVAVMSGKVAVGGRRAPVTLTAGTVGHVTDSTAVAAVAGDLREYTDWTAGRLVFNDVSVSAMLAVVGRWYGYTFRLTDSTLATERIAVVFNADKREETLSLLKALLKVTMQFDGNTITLSRQQNKHSVASPTIRWDANVSPSTEVGK